MPGQPLQEDFAFDFYWHDKAKLCVLEGGVARHSSFSWSQKMHSARHRWGAARSLLAQTSVLVGAVRPAPLLKTAVCPGRTVHGVPAGEGVLVCSVATDLRPWERRVLPLGLGSPLPHSDPGDLLPLPLNFLRRGAGIFLTGL